MFDKILILGLSLILSGCGAISCYGVQPQEAYNDCIMIRQKGIAMQRANGFAGAYYNFYYNGSYY